jgi:hypothetical protein
LHNFLNCRALRCLLSSLTRIIMCIACRGLEKEALLARYIDSDPESHPSRGRCPTYSQ